LAGDAFFWQGGPVGVLLSHGYTATTAEVRLLARRLYEQNYTIAGPLLPGHGTTPQAMNGCRWQDWAATVKESYLQLAGCCEQVFVGGESMGALLALFVAGEHPQARGIMAYCPALRIPTKSLVLSQLLYRFVPQVDKKDIKTINENWQGYPVNPLPALVQMIRLQREVTRRLPGIQQPLLIIQGRRDTAIDLKGVDMLYRKIGSSNKTLHWLEGSGHLVLLEKELDRVEDLTVAFMEKVLEKISN
jgi:carboxylesterase